MSFLKVASISRQSETGFALKGITFSQRRHEKVVVAGETGSGKSTLLRIIAGLQQADSGEVSFLDTIVTGPEDTLVPGRPGIAYLSQDFILPKFLRVEQVLSYANTLSVEVASILYEVCRIKHLLKRNTDQLSGGERQRIAIARLLISSPELLLLDEPFSNLDAVHKEILKAVLADIGIRLKVSTILISHDPADTLPWADRILVMKDGQIVQKGTPEKIYNEPQDEYVAGLFGRYNLIDSQSELYSKLKKGKDNNKKLIVRPEQFKVVSNRNHQFSGKVIDVNFYGGYYEVVVEAFGDVLILDSDKPVSLRSRLYIAFVV